MSGWFDIAKPLGGGLRIVSRRFMEGAHHKSPPALLTVASFGCFALLLWFAFAPPVLTARLSAARIAPDSGLAYAVAAPLTGYEPIAEWAADSGNNGEASELLLFEDGALLGAPHTMHATIREHPGKGYSHWSGAIYFAASDGSDPRTNGREYVVSGPVRLAAVTQLFALVLIVFTLFYTRLTRSHAMAAFQGALDIVTGWNPVKGLPAWLPAAGCIAGALAGLALYLFHLSMGFTSQVGVAGVLQISDAAGYWHCANQLIDYGETITWCHRRPLYPITLAGLSVLAGRNIELVLMFQAALMGAAIYVAAREVGRWLGLASAVAFSVILCWFTWTCIFGQTLTEFSGAFLGALATACLLRGAEQRSVWIASAGLFFLSAGLAARPAGVFVLPAAWVWLVWLAYRSDTSKVRAAAIGAAAIIAGYVTQYVGIIALHADQSGSFGNFSSVLYGLSVNGTWQTIFKDHPEITADTAEAYNAVYALAFDNIRRHPEIFAAGIVQNIFIYIDHLPAFAWAGERVRPLYFATIVVTAAAAVKSPRAALALAAMLGELASSTLLGRDAEMRIWATTLALSEALPPLVAIHSLLWWRRSSSPERFQAAPLARGPIPVVAMCLGGLIAVVAVIPFTPARALAAVRYQANGHQCKAGEAKIVTTLSHGAIILRVSNRYSQPLSFPRRINLKDLQNGLDPRHWAKAPDLPAVALIEAPLEKTDLNTIAFVYEPEGLNLPLNQRIAACVDYSRPVTVQTVEFGRIVSYQLAPRRP